MNQECKKIPLSTLVIEAGDIEEAFDLLKKHYKQKLLTLKKPYGEPFSRVLNSSDFYLKEIKEILLFV